MSLKEKTIWRNRIVGLGSKPAKDFVFNPLNWRTHPEFQRQTLNGILSEVGWVTGVIENIVTGHLLDGHARIEEALAKDDNEIVPFVQVELSVEEEQKILAVFDPIGSAAAADSEKFQELVSLVEMKNTSLTHFLEDLSADNGVVPGFEPASLSEQGKLDEFNLICCPKCNYEFAR